MKGNRRINTCAQCFSFLPFLWYYRSEKYTYRIHTRTQTHYRHPRMELERNEYNITCLANQ